MGDSVPQGPAHDAVHGGPGAESPRLETPRETMTSQITVDDALSLLNQRGVVPDRAAMPAAAKARSTVESNDITPPSSVTLSRPITPAEDTPRRVRVCTARKMGGWEARSHTPHTVVEGTSLQGDEGTEEDVERPSNGEIAQFRNRASKISFEDTLRERIKDADTRLEAIQNQNDPTSAQKMQVISLHKQRKLDLEKLSSFIMDRVKSRLREALKSFRDLVHGNLEQWAGVPDILEQLTIAMHAHADYKQHWEELLAVGSEHSKQVIQNMQLEENALLDHLRYDIMHSDESLDMDLQRMHETIKGLERLSRRRQDAKDSSHSQIGALRVFVRGVMLHDQNVSRPYKGINGEYKRTMAEFGGRPVYERVKNSQTAMWWSSIEGRLAWCVGPKRMIGTGQIWAYVEDTLGEGPESAGSRPWIVYSFINRSWEEQSHVVVENLDRPSTADFNEVSAL